ncbi:uncharacterized protein L3040_007494 [Drepanopeziza brunnea f. sp. 'multigermtubi']|uniref:Acetyltransferase n=1 Tax=Marssonina brunnea f. sp. multigermtubi (strain MB_m1) TaxID=1072389 RepID=K1XCJ3_MARBU|nr:acetyltransferase [Drepanopeziza brunnea f. sp. 'multigermtubi' MB_m1]EKD18483.1 acetyltransferase [Drepanopeziza brunnea f. sp. 'multigermtubi' MB_m1]KAJ5037318.1 hypothetical protein L3040_007494 [Drepanopeziza brunnea f. sp. 'multigermtubi']
MSSPPEYTLSLVSSEDDFLALATVKDSAFKSSAFAQLKLGPNTDLAGLAKYLLGSWKSDPEARFMKASLPSGQIIGFAKWNFFSTTDYHYPFPTEFLETGQPSLCKMFFDGLAKVMNEKMKGKKFIYMHFLAVDPKFQRMGIGKKLCDWGLKYADEKGLEAYIDASPEGKGLYEKCGWQVINTLDIDLSKWGGPKEISTSYNMWRPLGGVAENSEKV